MYQSVNYKMWKWITFLEDDRQLEVFPDDYIIVVTPTKQVTTTNDYRIYMNISIKSIIKTPCISII